MDQEMNKEVMMDDFFKSVLQGIDIENELVMWSNEKLADLLTTYIWADIDLNSPKSAVLSVAIERLKAARLTAADALAEKADKLLEHIEMGWAHGEECIALDVTLRKYREVKE